MKLRWYGMPQNVKGGYQDKRTQRMKERTVKISRKPKRREARNG